MNKIIEDYIVNYSIDIPFKNFLPGQVIQSKEFNDDMRDIEEKINEIIIKHNLVSTDYNSHLGDYENPHVVTAHQAGTYTDNEIDERFNQVQAGQIVDKSIDFRQLKRNVGELLNISSNDSIVNINNKLNTYDSISLTIIDEEEMLELNVHLLELEFEYIYER